MKKEKVFQYLMYKALDIFMEMIFFSLMWKFDSGSSYKNAIISFKKKNLIF